MTENINKIEEWTKSTFPGARVDINSTNIGALSALMKANELKEKDMAILIKQMKRECDEYKAEENMIQNILTSSGTSIERYSKTTARYIQSLATAAEVLNVQNPTYGNLLVAISDLHENFDELSLLENELNSKICRLKLKIPELKAQNEQLKKILRDLEDNIPNERREAEKMIKSTKFNILKAQQNAKDVEKLNEVLHQRNFTSELSHQNIVAQGENLKELNEKCNDLEIKLSTYQNLPPNIAKARQLLNEKSKEFADIESHVSNFITGEICNTPE